VIFPCQLVDRIRNPNADPGKQLNADPGDQLNADPDPDPKHFLSFVNR
jgi:hypothetical protein